MKKLMMTAAIVCAAVGVQAATIQWNSVNDTLYDGTGSSTAVSDGLSAYVILSSYSQSDFAAAYAANDGDATKTLAAVGVAQVGEGMTAYGAVFGNDFEIASAGNAYMVVFAADKVYIGGNNEIIIDPLDTSVGYLEIAATTGSDDAPGVATSYSNPGWYALGSSPTPEPTSGLLLLIGMAGLALRRRRA